MIEKSQADAAALKRLRDEIDTADADLVRAIGAERGNGELTQSRSTFTERFQMLFGESDQARAEAESLLQTLEQQLPHAPSGSAIQALLRGFVARAQVRAHKNDTRDLKRETEVIEKWKRNAEAANIDPETAVAIFRIILATSIRMQELQIKGTLDACKQAQISAIQSGNSAAHTACT
ncbi:MAG: chorismate mutase [Candidatus Peribacteraceae bacterium]|nr:chorismate mutase [Candidatus Peribacteraceae bacterium]